MEQSMSSMNRIVQARAVSAGQTSPVSALVKALVLLVLTVAVLTPTIRSTGTPTGEDMIVYTAHQTWLSRVYLLNMDGTVYDYFEYDMYRLVDVEVVDNEVYVVDAFAPRMFRLDLNNGELDLVIDDWSLYYFYDIAFDGTYFYVTEWDLNRYDINGVKDGTASFDQTVFGGAWDGQYLRTLGEDSLVRAWDVSNWPSVEVVPEESVVPPSGSCRGLWYDGEFFWTAESKDGELGQIYRFDRDGVVVDQWTEPAFNGWGACLVKGNRPPAEASQPYPADSAQEVPPDVAMSWSASDPDGDTLSFDVYFGSSHPLELVGEQQGDTIYDPPAALTDGTTYFWRVVTWDHHGDSTAGPEWSFTTTVTYICGDVDGSGDQPDVADLVYLAGYMFQNGPAPPVLEACDVDGNGTGPDVADLVYLVNFMFNAGPGLQCP
jgi:hypothetical protein